MDTTEFTETIKVPITPTPFSLGCLDTGKIETHIAKNINLRIFHTAPPSYYCARKLGDGLWVAAMVGDIA